MSQSAIAHLRQQIEQEYISAVQGLHGIALISRHDFINARYRRLDELHTELSAHVGNDAATKIISDIGNNIVKQG